MTDFSIEAKWAPRWLTIVIFLALTVALVAVANEYVNGDGFEDRELVSAGPFALLAAYGSLALALNRTRLQVLPGRIEIRSGPVPALLTQTITADRIEMCYYRSRVLKQKTGTVTVNSAGVQLHRNKWVEISSQYETQADAEAAAARAAAALTAGTGRKMRVVNSGGRLPRVGWRDRLGLIGWSTGFVLALMWAVTVDSLWR